MKLFRRKKVYLLSGRHSWFTSRLVYLVVFMCLVSVTVTAVILYRSHYRNLPSVESVYADWTAEHYLESYLKASEILARRPLDGEMLALKGFSAYYLSAAQVDSTEAQTYLVESIVSLRNAWHRVAQQERVPIAYVLGKAYYQRGFYYADLAMRYLDYANAAGASYPDLHEFRALAASLLGNHEVAIRAFTESLTTEPSDLLLFTLATSYAKNGDMEKAKQYFREADRTTKDELLSLRCKAELGLMFLTEGKIDEAEAEFILILEKDANSADALYGLGVVYDSRQDLVKARSYWRKAVRVNPMHAGARQKLGI